MIVAVVAEGGVKGLIAEKDDAAGGNLTVYRIGQLHLARQETQAASPVVPLSAMDDAESVSLGLEPLGQAKHNPNIALT